MLRLLTLFLQGDGREHQLELTQTAHFQAVVGIVRADGKGDGEGVFTGNHMVHIGSSAGHVVAAELNIAFSIAGEGVSNLIGLAGQGGEVVFQLHLPPVTGSILRSQGHGGGGVLTNHRSQSAFGPGLEALKAVLFTAGAGAVHKAVRMLGRRSRCLGLGQGDLSEGQTEFAQTTQFQTCICTLSRRKGHTEGILAFHHGIHVAGVAGDVFVGAELHVADVIGGKDKLCLISLAGFQRKVGLQLHLPPVGGGVLGDQGHGSLVILTSQRLHGCLGPGLVVFKAIGGHFGLFDRLDGVVLEYQLAVTQAAQFQTAVGLAAVLKLHLEGVLTHYHVVLVGGKVSSVVVDKLDAAGGIAGEGIGHFIALAGLAVDVLLQLDLPPIGGSVLACQGQGGSGILTGGLGHRAVRPDIEGAETVGSGCLGCGSLGLFDLFHGDLGEQQFTLAQTTQFQTAVAVAAGLEFHSKDVLALLYIVLIGTEVGGGVVDKLNTAFRVAGKGKLDAVVAALLGLQFLLQLHLPPVGGGVGVGQLQTFGRLAALGGHQCALGPDIDTGEGILRLQLCQLLLIHFHKVHVSKGQFHIAAIAQLTQFQAGALGHVLVGSQVEGGHTDIAFHPLGLGAQDRRGAVVDGVGHVLSFAAFLGKDEGGLVSLTLDQGAVHSQLHTPAFVCLVGGSQMTVSVLHHVAGGLISHVQEEGIQVGGQFLALNSAEGQGELVQSTQLQSGADLAAGVLTCGKADNELVLAGLHFILIGLIVGSAFTYEADSAFHIAGKTEDQFVVAAEPGIQFLGQTDVLCFAGRVGGG